MAWRANADSFPVEEGSHHGGQTTAKKGNRDGRREGDVSAREKERGVVLYSSGRAEKKDIKGKA